MKTTILFLFISFFGFSQDQMFDVCPLKIGQEIPTEHILKDKAGNDVSFSETLSGKKAIVVFYRGGWCPYCTRHLGALGTIKEAIDSLGFELIGITVDQFDSLGVSQLRSETDYTIYSDSKAELIQAFGIGWEIDPDNYVKYRDQYGMDTEKWTGQKHHILPVPAVYIIIDGVIQYNYVNPNYSVRLKPTMLKAILETL